MRRPLLAFFASFAASSLAGCATAGNNTQPDVDASTPVDAAPSLQMDGGGEAEAEASSVTVEQACQANAAGYCQQLEQCFPFAIQETWGDVMTCTATVATACADVLHAPGDGWTPDSLLACVQARDQLPCASFLLRKPELPVCRITGALDDGTACRYGAQCKSGYCKVTMGVCGYCVEPAARGGACTTYPDCSLDLLCAKNNTCQPPVASGGSCDDTHPCALGTACIGGMCMAPGGEGATCDPSLGSIDCDYYQQVYCDGTAMKCTKYVVAQTGQPCNVAGQSTVCAAGGGCMNGSCSAAGTAGILCNPSVGITCAYPLTCDKGVCRKVDPSECM